MTAQPIEYDCEGCGMHVHAFGIESVPLHGFCAHCAWLCEHVTDPVAMMKMRENMGIVTIRDRG